MSNDTIRIMIISTIPDMIAEHHYFIKHVFPDLKEICKDYDVNLEYVDLIFSMSKVELSQCRSIRKYFESIDMNRTFFFCFRGQKLGCAPTYRDVDKLTLDKYPELVDYIGDISFTELMIMHALNPFEKHGECGYECLPPVKHSMFYFRDEKFLNNLTDSQKELYISNGDDEDVFVRDLKLAMAKDFVFSNKLEFDQKDDNTHINIRKYEGIWDESLNLKDFLCQYVHEYAELNDVSYDDLMDLVSELNLYDPRGSFADFKCENKDLKDIIIEDFVNELKLELSK